jgi:hypothetical protein
VAGVGHPSGGLDEAEIDEAGTGARLGAGPGPGAVVADADAASEVSVVVSIDGCPFLDAAVVHPTLAGSNASQADVSATSRRARPRQGSRDTDMVPWASARRPGSATARVNQLVQQ